MRIAPCLLILVAVASSSAAAADRVFVQVTSIPGDSTDSAHIGWIDAYAIDSKVALPTGSPRAVFDDGAFLKGTDSASPLLNRAVATGQLFMSVVVDVCRSGTSGLECYYRVTYESARITGVTTAGSSCVGPGACTPSLTESVTVSYSRIRWKFTPYSGGAPGTPVERCFDVVANATC